jgi:hypothetical protein
VGHIEKLPSLGRHAAGSQQQQQGGNDGTVMDRHTRMTQLRDELDTLVSIELGRELRVTSFVDVDKRRTPPESLVTMVILLL